MNFEAELLRLIERVRGLDDKLTELIRELEDRILEVEPDDPLAHLNKTNAAGFEIDVTYGEDFDEDDPEYSGPEVV